METRRLFLQKAGLFTMGALLSPALLEATAKVKKVGIQLDFTDDRSGCLNGWGSSRAKPMAFTHYLFGIRKARRPKS